jgi:hypothetical protein
MRNQRLTELGDTNARLTANSGDRKTVHEGLKFVFLETQLSSVVRVQNTDT